jgi:hypothetical protein
MNAAGVFTIWLSLTGIEDESYIYGLIVGVSLLIISIVCFGRLIFELRHPTERLLRGKLIRLNSIKPLRAKGYFGFNLIVEADGKKEKLLLIHKKVKFIMDKWPLYVLLRENETYNIKFLSKSKVITEIESISHPELNAIIDACAVGKKVSKRDKKRAFNRLEEYMDR